jgi:pimeloyl-ACP methyl ester carboxylesterase
MQFGVFPGLAHLIAYPSSWSIIYVRHKPHWDAIGSFDAVPYWWGLNVPALVLFGENDTNVPSVKSAEVLRAMNKPNIEVKNYSGSGHALESPVGQGQSIFRADAMTDIVALVRASGTKSTQGQP